MQVVVLFLQIWLLWRGYAVTRRQLRAYVFVDQAVIHHTGANERPRIKLRIKNFGQTPAYDYAASLLGYQFVNASAVPARALAIDAHQGRQSQSGGSIAPGGTFELGDTLARAITPDERDALVKGTKVLYIAGEIRYKDAFAAKRSTKRRSTKYRFVYGGDYGFSEGSLSVAEYGNDAD